MTEPILKKPWLGEPKSLYPIPRSQFKDPSWMTQNISDAPGEKLACITHMDVQDTDIPVTTTDGYELLCSYSWKDIEQPTIYVPGTPPRWTPPVLPMQLKKDEGSHWIDQHAGRVPKFQFEPIFQSLAIMNPNARFDSVDIVVNRNTLQKFFAFASLKRGYNQFYVDLDMAGKTLFISKREKNAQTKAQSGYGRNFETTFMSEDPGLANADGHHRVIKYNIGGLKMVVRIEADGYLVCKDSTTATPLKESGNFLGTMAPASAAIVHHHPRHTHVIAQGVQIPHNHSVELKSNNDKTKAREQIWFGRVPHLIFAKHKQGLVTATEHFHWGQDDFEAWSMKNQRSLRRLVWLLKEIRRVVMEKTNGAAVLVAIEKGAPLQIFPAKHSFGALPKEIVERFWDEQVEA